MNNYCDWKKWVNPLIPIHFFVQNVANDFVENITWQLSDSVGITYARRTVRIFTVSPQSCSLFSALFQTFCLTAQAYLNTQKYGLFRSLKWNKLFTINWRKPDFLTQVISWAIVFMHRSLHSVMTEREALIYRILQSESERKALFLFNRKGWIQGFLV